MIEELKAYTIDKIKSIKVVAENSLRLLLISLRYDIKLEDAELFFKAHLLELLSKEEALLLDQEYVYSIFTDDTLSYVSRQTLFLFLVKWVAHCPARNEAFPELMSALKLDYINSEGLDDVDMNSLNDENQTLCRTLASKTCNLDNILIVCQAQLDYKNGTSYLHAFNADKRYWFSIRLSQSIDYGLGKACIENKMVLVYLKDKTTLCKFNLGTNIESQKIFKWLDELDAQIHSTSSSSDYTCIRHMSNSTEKLYVVREARLKTHNIIKERIVSAVYCNDKTYKSNVYMKALISVKGEVTQFGVTDVLVCLIVKRSKRLTVYAADVGIISTVDLSQLRINHNTVFSAVGGGKIYITTNTNLVVQINIYKESLAIKTSVRETVLKGGINVSTINKSTRFERRKNPTHFQFTEDKIITITYKNVSYKTVLSFAYQKLPEDINSVHKEENVDMGRPKKSMNFQDVHFLEAYLPSDAPKCHDKCPHCSFKVNEVNEHYEFCDYTY